MADYFQDNESQLQKPSTTSPHNSLKNHPIKTKMLWLTLGIGDKFMSRNSRLEIDKVVNIVHSLFTEFSLFVHLAIGEVKISQ